MEINKCLPGKKRHGVWIDTLPQDLLSLDFKAREISGSEIDI